MANLPGHEIVKGMLRNWLKMAIFEGFSGSFVKGMLRNWGRGQLARYFLYYYYFLILIIYRNIEVKTWPSGHNCILHIKNMQDVQDRNRPIDPRPFYRGF